MPDLSRFFRLFKWQDYIAAGGIALLIWFELAKVFPVWTAACLALACLLIAFGIEWIIREYRRGNSYD